MPKATRNAGLGKLKGIFQERKSRLDAAIDADSGYKPKSKDKPKMKTGPGAPKKRK
jgi:hypothetical protein